MVRDWYARELEDMAKKAKGVGATVIQCVYRGFQYKNEFQKRKKAADQLEVMIRGTLERQEYYERKWIHVQKKHRSLLSELIRASMRRDNTQVDKFAYYHERKKFFLEINRELIQDYIKASVMRQRYYELKMKYMEAELIKKESMQMIKYDHYADKYMAELRKQQADEANERRIKLLEDNYVKEVKEAKEREKQQQLKENFLMAAEEAYRDAAHMILKVKKHDEDALWYEMMLEQNREKIEAKAKEKAEQVYHRIEQISRRKTEAAMDPEVRRRAQALKAPWGSGQRLPRLPNDTDEVGLYKYFEQNIKQSEAARVAARVAHHAQAADMSRTYDTDLRRKLTDEQQKIFVERVAGLLNVSEDELVVHMTPRTPDSKRRPDYSSPTYQGRIPRY